MKRLLLLVFIFFFSFKFSAQENKLYFSEALDLYLPKYKAKVKQAYRLKQEKRATFLFDSLITNCLKDTYLNNFKVHDVSKSVSKLYDYQKPIILLTYASWCVADKGEIPAINQLASEAQDKVKFVILFWDKRKAAIEAAKEYSSLIDVLYVNELTNKNDFVVKNLKHALGFPTVYQIGSDKQIVNIKRLEKLPYSSSFEKSFNLNYSHISSGISEIVAHEKELLSTVKFAISD